MFTISSIIEDISRGCTSNNMIEDYFSYRIVFFINEGGKSSKFYVDTSYSGLRRALENIIRNNLSVTNTVVISQTTAVKNGKAVCLQSRSYSFSLDRYFQQISGENSIGNRKRNTIGRYAIR